MVERPPTESDPEVAASPLRVLLSFVVTEAPLFIRLSLSLPTPGNGASRSYDDDEILSLIDGIVPSAKTSAPNTCRSLADSLRGRELPKTCKAMISSFPKSVRLAAIDETFEHTEELSSEDFVS